MSDLPPMIHFIPRRMDQYPEVDGWKVLQVVVTSSAVSFHGPNPAGNYMLVFGDPDSMEEVEVVVRPDQFREIAQMWNSIPEKDEWRREEAVYGTPHP